MRELQFKEVQRFRQLWLWLVLLFALGFVAWDIIEMTIHQTGQEDRGEIILNILFYIIPLFVVVFFWIIRFETRIDVTGIYYRFYPIHTQERKISWLEVNKIYVRKYSPLMEYGGWGWRYSIRNGRAYNISGNKGLQIIDKDGKKLLLGTQKPIEIEDLLRELKESGVISTATDNINIEERKLEKDRF